MNDCVERRADEIDDQFGYYEDNFSLDCADAVLKAAECTLKEYQSSCDLELSVAECRSEGRDVEKECGISLSDIDYLSDGYDYDYDSY